MSDYARSVLWAAVMILIALASRAGLIGEGAGQFMLMAALAGWVATKPRGSQGSCRLWSFRP